jgi:hypothetical protein
MLNFKYNNIIIKIGPLGQQLDNMMGGNPNPTSVQYGAAMQEAASDAWINRNVPGGVNSRFQYA